MPRVHQLTANKDYPDKGIKKGDKYYKWTTRPGGRGKGIVHRQLTYPRPQQLTSSDFLIQMYDLQDRINDVDVTSLEDERDNIAEDIRALGDEQQNKLDNMPEGLQQGSSGEMLQSRVDGCEAWASDVENVDIPDREDYADDDEYAEAMEQALQELQNCSYSGD